MFADFEYFNDATFVWDNNGKHKKICFSIKKEVKSIGNPVGIGQGTGFGLRERDRDRIGLGHSRLRASYMTADAV